MVRTSSKPRGEVTRGTTNPNRLRRMDRWIAATQPAVRAGDRPLAVDLGYGASPITAVELYTRLRAVSPRLEVVGIEIEPDRVAAGRDFLARHPTEGLSFVRGGFELPVDRAPALVRAANVLRQYDEPAAWRHWDDLCSRLAPGGVLVEGTCDELGRRHVWVALERGGPTGRDTVRAAPRTITFAAHLPTLGQPSDLAERLPKTLIHRNVPGERVHALLAEFDRCWATAAPQSVFGPRARWITAVELLAHAYPVLRHPPFGGRGRWRLGEVTLPWSTVDPLA